ncbi:hypothetical protein B0H10DRAFT_1947007 [Mycena sp. CBHHK59/15]|nr:hypothetical protein B0H10DRAFT_1947007 [Mycena sp. CBHHK59/15]
MSPTVSPTTSTLGLQVVRPASAAWPKSSSRAVSALPMRARHHLVAVDFNKLVRAELTRLLTIWPKSWLPHGPGPTLDPFAIEPGIRGTTSWLPVSTNVWGACSNCFLSARPHPRTPAQSPSLVGMQIQSESGPCQHLWLGVAPGHRSPGSFGTRQRDRRADLGPVTGWHVEDSMAAAGGHTALHMLDAGALANARWHRFDVIGWRAVELGCQAWPDRRVGTWALGCSERAGTSARCTTPTPGAVALRRRIGCDTGAAHSPERGKVSTVPMQSLRGPPLGCPWHGVWRDRPTRLWDDEAGAGLHVDTCHSARLAPGKSGCYAWGRLAVQTPDLSAC